MMTQQELDFKISEQVELWDSQAHPLDQRISSLRQVRQAILSGLYPEILFPTYYLDTLISEYEESLLPEYMKTVDNALMQLQNISSLYFHEQQLNLPTQQQKLQDQKKTYMLLKTLVARIHTQLYSTATVDIKHQQDMI